MAVTKFQKIVEQVEKYVERLKELDFSVLNEAARLADNIEALKEQSAAIDKTIKDRQATARGELSRINQDVEDAKQTATLAVRTAQSDAAKTLSDLRESTAAEKRSLEESITTIRANVEKEISALVESVENKRSELQLVESQLSSTRVALNKLRAQISAGE